MKRKGNLMPKIVNYVNIEFAHKNAKKNKREKHKKEEIEEYEKNAEELNFDLIDMLSEGRYTSSNYRFYTIVDKGKEREIASLPYYPDRLVHWSVLNIVEKVFFPVFISSTYASIKGRGVDRALRELNKDLRKHKEMKYCLKIDVRKFFPNIDKEILKNLFRKVIKDKAVMIILDEIVDGYPKSGIPIGNYTSQWFGNFYLAYFDHWVKEDKRVKCYHRYMDDMIFLGETKEELWALLDEIKAYLSSILKLEVKSNYQVFPIADRGVDFVGYKSYPTKITIRSANKYRGIRRMNRIKYLKKLHGDNYYHSKRRQGQVSSYYGIFKRATGNKLINQHIRLHLPKKRKVE